MAMHSETRATLNTKNPHAASPVQAWRQTERPGKRRADGGAPARGIVAHRSAHAADICVCACEEERAMLQFGNLVLLQLLPALDAQLVAAMEKQRIVCFLSAVYTVHLRTRPELTQTSKSVMCFFFFLR